MQRFISLFGFIFPILVIAALCQWTHSRNAVWGSEISLMRDNVIKSPNKPRALLNYAWACKKLGLDEEGIAAMARAINEDPEIEHYLAALTFVEQRGGHLVTERDVWNHNPKYTGWPYW